MADIKTALITDTRLLLTDDLDFGVFSGASSSTYQQFNAVSQSGSSITFNCQIPSESVVVNREISIRSTIKFSVAISGVAVGVQAFNLGLTDAPQSFPLNKLFTTLTAQINNTNVSVNSQDVIDSLLRLNDSRELYRYNGMCPTYPDSSYLNYANGVLASNNALASYLSSSLDICEQPRGAFPLQFFSVSGSTTNGTAPYNIAAYPTPALYAASGRVISTGLADSWVFTFNLTVTEPLVGLAPFIFGKPEYNGQGIGGCNTISIVANIDSTCKRFWSTASNATSYVVALDPQTPFSNSAMLLNFLSTQPSQLLPVKNIVPYTDYPRYLSLASGTPTIVGWTGSGNLPSSATIVSQNIQLNQIPDEFLITVRIQMSQQTVKNSASFLTINSISINLNNASGLLSSATPQDLWQISVSNGSTQTWEEFSGIANANSNASGCGQIVPTTGSLLILNPVKDLSLPDFISSSSIGQYNFQVTVNVSNYYTTPITPEVCIICANSGIFITERGTSQIFTGVLTKQMVLDAKEKREVSPVNTCEYRRLVGGKMHHRGLAGVKRMFAKHKVHHAPAHHAMHKPVHHKLAHLLK